MDNTFSWFIPEKMGTPRPEVRRAIYAARQISNPIWSDMNGRYSSAGRRHQVRPSQSANVPGAAAHPRARTVRVRDEDARRRVLRAGQVADEARPHAQRRRALRHRSVPVRAGPGKSALQGASRPYPIDKNNIAPRLGLVWNPDGESKSVVRAVTGCSTTGRCWERSTTSSRTSSTRSRSWRISRRRRRHGPAQRAVPDRSDAESRPTSAGSRPTCAPYINSVYPPGTTVRNTATVTWDDARTESSRISIRSAPDTSAKYSRAFRCRPTTSA